jgi:hypothetical protein
MDTLHTVIGRIILLTQLVKGFEMEPNVAELREIAGEPQDEKAKAHKKPQPLLGSKDPHVPHVAGKAFEMREAS